MNLTLGARTVGEVTIIDAEGRITLGEATVLLRDTILAEADKNPRIILNLAEVTYVDSAGLGEMLGSYTSVRNKGGDLKLLNVTKRVRDLLQITRLLTIFETFDDEAAAVSSFGRAASA